VPVTHHYRSEVVSATCTEGGCTRYTCSACGDSYTENPIEALGHSFTHYVSDGNATTAADGTKTAKCDRCEVTNTIPDPGSRLLADVVMTDPTPHHTGIIIRWNAVEGAQLYQIYRLASGETAWTLIKNTGSTAYKDETAAVGVKYYYKVRARDGQRMSSLNIQSVSAIRPLANVVMTGATPHATGNIIRWNAVEGAVFYQVYRLRSGETAWTLLKNTGSTAYKDETAVEGIKYYYKVRARNGQLMSSMNIASVSAIRPAAVTKLDNVTMEKAVGHATGNIIYWNAVKNAKLYQVYRLRSGETSWTLLKNTGSLAYKDETAEVGVKYYYKVVARNGDIKSGMNITSVSAVRPAK
jgi:fibronectin type 3 domain-containing protein